MAEIQAFAENVWIVDGPKVRDFGIMFTTRMTIVKLSSGSLWVSSPVSVPFDTLKRICAEGPVKFLVAGTPRHVWRLAGWPGLVRITARASGVWVPCSLRTNRRTL